MKEYTVKDIVMEISERENFPASSPYKRFVGLEHYDIGEVKISRFGSTGKLESAMKIFHKGDILIARRNVYLKRAAVVNFDGLTSGDSIVLRANDEKIKDILPFIFNTDAFWDFANRYADGTMSKRLSPKTLMEYKFSLPEGDELLRLSQTLWAAYDLKESYKRLLVASDEMAKSQFIEMFGDLAAPHCKWQKEMLIDSCPNSDDIKCGPFGTQLNKEEYRNSGVAVWEIPQINSGFMTSPTHYLTAEKASQLEAYSLIPGDIAMSRKGNVGKCAIFPAYFQPGIIHSDVLRIRLDQRRVSPVFMMYQLHISGAVQHQIELVSSGAIMAGINVTKLKKIYVHLPPLELQNEFAAFVEQLDKSKVELQKSIDSLDASIKSLIKGIF